MKLNLLIKPKFDFLYLIFGLFIFIYIILRAIYVPLFGDEVNTFFMYVKFGDFLPWSAHLDANNHLLNSLITYVFFHCFGGTTIILRLANILSFLVFAWYLWKLRTFFQSRYIALCFFIVMMSSHYFITFFHLCRGYGMSMAFLTGACYYLLVFISQGKMRQLSSGLLMCTLAIWSNLSLIVPAIAIGSLFAFFTARHAISFRSVKKIISGFLIFAGVFLIPLVLAAWYSMALQKAGLLYHGYGIGFIDTLFVRFSFEYARSLTWGPWIFGILLLALLASTIFVVIRKRNIAPYFYFHIILWSTLAGTVILHRFFNVKYPEDRAALYFFLLFMICFFFTLDHAGHKIFLWFSSLTALMLVIHLVFSMNLRYTDYWANESVPRSFVDKFKKTFKKTGMLPMINSDDLWGYAWDYFDYRSEGALNSTQVAGYPFKYADFIIANSFFHEPCMPGFDTVDYDKKTGIAILERRNHFEWKKMGIYKVPPISSSDNIIYLFQLPAEKFVGHPFCFDIEFSAFSDQEPLIWWMYFEQYDSTGQSTYYDKVELQRMKSDVREKRTFHRRQFMDMISATTKSIGIQIWKIKGGTVDISDIRVKVYEIENP